MKILKPLYHPRHKQIDTRGANERGYTYRWQQYAKQFLREHPLCARCEKEGVTEAAEVVDHIIPVRGPYDSLFWVASNHQALSARCHSIKTREDDAKLAQSSTYSTRVVIVYGLPASGKTTYVLNTMERGDIIVDMDRLAEAISGLPRHSRAETLLPFTASARDAIYARLRRPSDINTAWIITTDINAARRLSSEFGGSMVEMKVDEEERQRRIAMRNQDLGATGG